MRRALSLALTGLTVSLLAAERPEPGRLIAQSDFSAGVGNGWTVENFRDILTFGSVREGSERALCIRNDRGDKDTSFSLRSPIVPVRPGDEYAVIIEAKGEVPYDAPVNKNGLATAVAWYDGDQKPIERMDVRGRMLPIGDSFGFKALGEHWQWNVVLGTVPAEARFAAVQIGGDAPDILPPKRLLLKRVALRVRDNSKDWDFGDLTAPKIEYLTPSPSTDEHAALRFTIADESKLKRGEFHCFLDGTEITRQLKREGKNGFVYRHPEPWPPNSLYVLKVVAADVWGNLAEEQFGFFCAEPLTKGLVTLRDDGMTLLDGRPFFPIGPFGVGACDGNGNDIDRGIAEMKAAGINMVHTYRRYGNEDYEALVEACDRHGMKLIAEPTNREYGGVDFVVQLQDSIRYGRQHECFLGWCIGDDTASHRTPAEVRRDHHLIKAMDNARLTTQADGTSYAGRYRPFVHATDSMMAEIYPFRSVVPEPDGLARVIRAMKNGYGDIKAAGNPVKGFWGLLQAFSGWKLWERFPTLAEVRAQTYLSIIHGSRAATFYTYYGRPEAECYGAISTPERKAEFFSLTRELASIHDDLASRDAKVQPAVEILSGPKTDLCSYPSVTCILKSGSERGQLLIAGNSTTAAVKAKILVKGCKSAEVLFENRRLKPTAGITDDFASGAIHVYRLVMDNNRYK